MVATIPNTTFPSLPNCPNFPKSSPRSRITPSLVARIAPISLNTNPEYYLNPTELALAAKVPVYPLPTTLWGALFSRCVPTQRASLLPSPFLFYFLFLAYPFRARRKGLGGQQKQKPLPFFYFVRPTDGSNALGGPGRQPAARQGAAAEAKVGGRGADEYRRLCANAVPISEDMVATFIQMMEELGVAYVRAPFEADAEMAFLVRSRWTATSPYLGVVACCSGNAREFRAEDLARCDGMLKGFNAEDLLILAPLCGCDCTEGVGVKRGSAPGMKPGWSITWRGIMLQRPRHFSASSTWHRRCSDIKWSSTYASRGSCF